ncbi:MAG: putative quinol monooxygenase [Acidimicrobiales bacterium]|nr:putative quinol monooxygenase [Acidimicrobiales bacterium]
MILVIGDVTLAPGSRDEALALSRDHVARSRTEPGCISHDVHLHADDPDRIVFVERWADRAALDAHFAVAASRDFARALTALAAQAPRMDVYETDGGD